MSAPSVDALALTLSGLGGFVLAVLAGISLVVVAVRGVRIHLDRKER